MTRESKNIVIVGAGVLGCAAAYELAQNGFRPWVLELGPRIAEGTTSRNSGVVHAGLYYPPDSLKAQACIRGSHLLFEWCEQNQVSYRRTGKLVVGNPEDLGELEWLVKNATASGAKDVRMATSAELREQKDLKSRCGVWSPNTGIVDPFEYANSFRVQAEEKGAEFVMNTQVNSIENNAETYRIETNRGPIDADIIVNCAGLHSDLVANMISPDQFEIFPCRGNYFKLSKPLEITRLIYPVKKKNAPGLGIHLTIDLNNQQKLGPDAHYINSKDDYSEPDDIEALRDVFFTSASKYLDGLNKNSVVYDSCGIRPKLRSPSEAIEKDFYLSEDAPRFFNLIGIESPGLTASRDLAQRLAKLILA